MTRKVSPVAAILFILMLASYLWAVAVLVHTITSADEAADQVPSEVRKDARDATMGAGLLAASVPLLIGTVALVGFGVVTRLEDTRDAIVAALEKR